MNASEYWGSDGMLTIAGMEHVRSWLMRVVPSCQICSAPASSFNIPEALVGLPHISISGASLSQGYTVVASSCGKCGHVITFAADVVLPGFASKGTT